MGPRAAHTGKVVNLKRRGRRLELDLGGRYQHARLLGRGGMGEVWAAHDVDLDCEVAIKILSPELSSDAEFVQRFRSEMRTLARFTHPRIVPIMTAGTIPSDKRLFMVMKLLTGRTLRAILDENEANGRVFDDVTAALLTIQMISALGAAHEQGIIHRDVKPENMIVREKDGHLTLLDFGVAKVAEVTGPSKTGTGLFGAFRRPGPRTHQSVLLGTPRYMAPEVILRRVPDQRSDLYAVGIVLVKMLTNVYVYDVDPTDDVAVMRAHIEQEPVLRRERNVQCREILWEIAGKLLAKDPAHRFQTADDVDEALAVFLRESAPPAVVVVAEDERRERALRQRLRSRGPQSSRPADVSEPRTAEASKDATTVRLGARAASAADVTLPLPPELPPPGTVWPFRSAPKEGPPSPSEPAESDPHDAGGATAEERGMALSQGRAGRQFARARDASLGPAPALAVRGHRGERRAGRRRRRAGRPVQEPDTHDIRFPDSPCGRERRRDAGPHPDGEHSGLRGEPREHHRPAERHDGRERKPAERPGPRTQAAAQPGTRRAPQPQGQAQGHLGVRLMSSNERRGGKRLSLGALFRQTSPTRLRKEREQAREAAARPTPVGFWASDEESRALEAEINAARERGADEHEGAASEERPVTRAAHVERSAHRKWPTTWKLVAAAAVVAATMPVLVWVAGREKEPARTTPPAVTAPTAAAATAPAPSASVAEPPTTSAPVHTTEPVPSPSPPTAAPSTARGAAKPPHPPRHPRGLPVATSRPMDAPSATAKPAASPPQDPGLNE